MFTGIHVIILNTCKSFRYMDALLFKPVSWASWLLTMSLLYIYPCTYSVSSYPLISLGNVLRSVTGSKIGIL